MWLAAVLAALAGATVVVSCAPAPVTPRFSEQGSDTVPRAAYCHFREGVECNPRWDL